MAISVSESVHLKPRPWTYLTFSSDYISFPRDLTIITALFNADKDPFCDNKTSTSFIAITTSKPIYLYLSLTPPINRFDSLSNSNIFYSKETAWEG